MLTQRKVGSFATDLISASGPVAALKNTSRPRKAADSAGSSDALLALLLFLLTTHFEAINIDAMNIYTLKDFPDAFASSTARISRISTSSPALFALCAFTFVSLVCFVIYQLYIHPLAKYPGPLLGRITRLYDLYHAYKGDKHILLYRLHRKYGTVVRYCPNTVSINDPAAMKAIYSHGANVTKNEFYKCFRAAPHAISTLLATEKAHHAKKRRIASQAFSETAMRGLEKYVLAHTKDMTEQISSAVRSTSGEKQDWSKAMDMQKWANWFVFDVMGDLVFGKSMGTLGAEPQNREAIRLLGQAARRNYAVAAFPPLMYYGMERWVPPFRKIYQDRCNYLAFGKSSVMERTERDKKEGDTGRKDIFSFMLHARDPETGQGLPMQELWMESNTLIVAGSDTSSTTLAATLYYLLRNPATLQHLEREIRRTFKHADDIHSGPQLTSCTYLRACIDETMRMSPAVAGLLPREVLPGGLSIPALDLEFPAGVIVGTCTYAIQHHSDYVLNPFQFDPSRWLGDHRQDKHALQQVFYPFSLGHRACLGRPLVYMELSIALARLVWEFDMRLAPEQHEPDFVKRDVRAGRRHPSEYHFLDFFLSDNFGPHVEFRVRQESEA